MLFKIVANAAMTTEMSGSVAVDCQQTRRASVACTSRGHSGWTPHYDGHPRLHWVATSHITTDGLHLVTTVPIACSTATRQ